jgi:hypothetical protein
MTPREEVLATGQLGVAGAKQLYAAVWSVAVGNRFPPPEGASGWDETAVAEVAHDFLAGDRGRKRLLDITVRATDDRSFDRLLEAAVLNFLRDLARGTDLGKLIRRCKEILRGEAEFVAIPGPPERWALRDGPTAVGTAAAEKLASAMSGVEVVVPRWTSEHRDPPLADRASFIRLMRSVLTASGGSLTAEDIARVLTVRLDHRRVPYTVSLDNLERVAEPARDGGDPASSTVARLHATDIFNSLSDRERMIVTAIEAEMTIRELASMLDMGRSQTALVRQRLVDRLLDEFADDEDAEGTAHELCSLCVDWLEERTEPDGATSEDSRGEERGDGDDN